MMELSSEQTSQQPKTPTLTPTPSLTPSVTPTLTPTPTPTTPDLLTPKKIRRQPPPPITLCEEGNEDGMRLLLRESLSNDIRSAGLPPVSNPYGLPQAYESIVSQMQQISKNPRGFLAYVISSSSSICATGSFAVSVFILSLLPTTMIAIGSAFINQCPAQPYIPVYLIVTGALGTVQLALQHLRQRVLGFNNSGSQHQTTGGGAGIPSDPKPSEINTNKTRNRGTANQPQFAVPSSATSSAASARKVDAKAPLIPKSTTAANANATEGFRLTCSLSALSFCNAVYALLLTALIACSVAGSIWIAGIYWPNFDDHDSDNYCNPVLYNFALIAACIINAALVMIAALVLCSISCIACCTFFRCSNCVSNSTNQENPA